MDIFHDLKDKIIHIQDKYQKDQIKLERLSRDKRDLVAFNE